MRKTERKEGGMKEFASPEHELVAEYQVKHKSEAEEQGGEGDEEPEARSDGGVEHDDIGSKGWELARVEKHHEPA